MTPKKHRFRIKEFRNVMVNAHGKAKAESITIAQSKNITLPAGERVSLP